MKKLNVITLTLPRRGGGKFHCASLEKEGSISPPFEKRGQKGIWE